VQQILVTAILIALWPHVTMDNYHKLMFASLVQIFSFYNITVRYNHKYKHFYLKKLFQMKLNIFT